MITELILGIFFDIIMGFFSLLPAFDWIVPTSWVGFVQDAMSVVGYLLPMGTVQSIISLIFTFIIFRAVMALIRLIRDFLPII